MEELYATKCTYSPCKRYFTFLLPLIHIHASHDSCGKLFLAQKDFGLSHFLIEGIYRNIFIKKGCEVRRWVERGSKIANWREVKEGVRDRG